MGQNQSTGGGGGKKEVSSTRLSDPRQTSSDVARAPEERERGVGGRVGLNHDLWLVIYAKDDRLTASVPLFPFFFFSSLLLLSFVGFGFVFRMLRGRRRSGSHPPLRRVSVKNRGRRVHKGS